MGLFDAEAKSSSVVTQSKKRDETQILADMGLFGVHMAVIGLGVEVLGDDKRVGRNLMKLGALIGVAGYGVRWLS